MPFAKLFRSAPQASDRLTQPAREAIVDVLHLCMYADSHLALSEDSAIEQIAASFAWDPKISFDSYEAKSVGAVRQALGDPALRGALFASIRDRLPGAELRNLALSLGEKVFKADGTKSDRESTVAAELRKALLAG